MPVVVYDVQMDQFYSQAIQKLITFIDLFGGYQDIYDWIITI